MGRMANTTHLYITHRHARLGMLPLAVASSFQAAYATTDCSPDQFQTLLHHTHDSDSTDHQLAEVCYTILIAH